MRVGGSAPMLAQGEHHQGNTTQAPAAQELGSPLTMRRRVGDVTRRYECLLKRYVRQSSAHCIGSCRDPTRYGTSGWCQAASRRQLTLAEPRAAKTRYATSRRSIVSPRCTTTPSDHRTRARVMRSETDLDDVDTEQEDHCYDALRYRVSRKSGAWQVSEWLV